jgi:hypothetical protein
MVAISVLLMLVLSLFCIGYLCFLMLSLMLAILQT